MVKDALQNIIPLVQGGHLSPSSLCQVQDAAVIEQTLETMKQGSTIGREKIDLTIPAYDPTRLAVKIKIPFKVNLMQHTSSLVDWDG